MSTVAEDRVMISNYLKAGVESISETYCVLNVLCIKGCQFFLGDGQLGKLTVYSGRHHMDLLKRDAN
jgi:hypothetical protein